jgi:hypothetical protein
MRGQLHARGIYSQGRVRVPSESFACSENRNTFPWLSSTNLFTIPTPQSLRLIKVLLLLLLLLLSLLLLLLC